MLLKAGMTVRQAIVYNLLSAMMAYVGMLIGTAVGQYANNITLWIFAVTAGMFLYVALVDMVRSGLLPALLNCVHQPGGGSTCAWYHPPFQLSSEANAWYLWGVLEAGCHFTLELHFVSLYLFLVFSTHIFRH